MTQQPSQRVNYDLIAHLYDEPVRDHAVDQNLIQFLSERPARSLADLRILDLGCGTGKQLTANRQHYAEPILVGLDLFRGMLRQAQQRSNAVTWTQGDSTNPPFKEDSFDYITNQFSYHHMVNKARFFPQVYRILRPGGRFVLTNIDPWSMPKWLIYRYFPAAQQRDFVDCYPGETLTARLEQAGFLNVQITRQHLQRTETLKEVLAYALQRHRTSQLIVISDEEYQAGLNRIREKLTTAGENTNVESEICLIVARGDKK